MERNISWEEFKKNKGNIDELSDDDFNMLFHVVLREKIRRKVNDVATRNYYGTPQYASGFYGHIDIQYGGTVDPKTGGVMVMSAGVNKSDLTAAPYLQFKVIHHVDFLPDKANVGEVYMVGDKAHLCIGLIAEDGTFPEPQWKYIWKNRE